MRSRSPSIVPPEANQDTYLVLDDFGGRFGRAWRETNEDDTDRETLIRDLMDGQYGHPARIVTPFTMLIMPKPTSNLSSSERSLKLKVLPGPTPMRASWAHHVLCDRLMEFLFSQCTCLIADLIKRTFDAVPTIGHRLSLAQPLLDHSHHRGDIRKGP